MKIVQFVSGHPVSVYESASTSMFKDGRTETIRPCTKEVIEVAKMMETVSEINLQQSCARIFLVGFHVTQYFSWIWRALSHA